MERNKEIEIIKSLSEDTYFAEFFGQDIDQMCDNIKNDFPIEIGTRFNHKAECLQRQINEMKSLEKQAYESFVASLIKAMEGEIPSDVYEEFVNKTSKMFVIQTKRAMGFELEDFEIDWLIQKAASNQ